MADNQDAYESELKRIDNSAALLTDSQNMRMAPLTPLNSNQQAISPIQALQANRFVDRMIELKSEQNRSYFVC